MRTAIVLACVGAAGLLALSAAAGDETDFSALKPAERLVKLDWMRGEWIRDQAGDKLEEIWSAPSGDSLIGMFRWAKGNRAWMFELMSITVEKGQVRFRLKHFDRNMIGWEEKDQALSYTLKSQGPREVIFENPKRNDPRRFIYALDEQGRLVVRLESEREGTVGKTEFVFTKR